MFISVVVPVYNTKPYLSELFNSLIPVIEEGNEVVFVDDGSSDGSSGILDSYSQRYNCIRVIHKSNAGVSSARNVGLQAASGEYVFFLDADDYIDSSSLLNACNLANKLGLDVLITEILSFTEEKGLDESQPYKVRSLTPHIVLSGVEAYEAMFNSHEEIGSVCHAVFRRDFLIDSSLEFELGLKQKEDTLYMTRVFIAARRVSYCDFVVLMRRRNDSSVSRTTSRSSTLLNWVKYYQLLKGVLEAREEAVFAKKITREEQAILREMSVCINEISDAIANRDGVYFGDDAYEGTLRQLHALASKRKILYAISRAVRSLVKAMLGKG